MPSFTIHIAIAKQYIKKHQEDIKSEEDFIKGVIAPDIVEDKHQSHYGNWEDYKEKTNIDKFLKNPIVDMKQDYWKGYFTHLLTDHYFYTQYFKRENEEIAKNKDKFYDDYNYLNKILIEKYKIETISIIKKYMDIFEGTPKYLKYDKIISFIEEISNMDITDKIEIIKEKGMEGLE